MNFRRINGIRALRRRLRKEKMGANGFQARFKMKCSAKNSTSGSFHSLRPTLESSGSASMLAIPNQTCPLTKP
jgi:hypothetical protein